MEEFEKRITEAMQINDATQRDNEVKKIILDLKKKFRNESVDFIEEQICDVNSDDLLTMARFFMLASRCAYESSIYCINEYADFFEKAFETLTMESELIGFKEEFLELLRTNDLFQEEYASFFKDIGYRDEYSYINNLGDILKLPSFKKNVLNDYVFFEDILNHMSFPSQKYYLLCCIPKEYGYLILLFNDYTREWDKRLMDLFNIHFKDRLTKENIEEIMKLRERILSKSNPAKLNQGYRLRKLIKVLQGVLEDEGFYTNIKKIQSIANLEFEVAVNFTYKYCGTILWNDLLGENDEINDEMQEKIEYLAGSERKECSDQLTLTALEKMTINDLKNLEKQRNIKRETFESYVQGGPDSNTLIHFIPDWDEIVCIRINYDGTKDKEEYPMSMGTHIRGLERLYGIKNRLPMEIAEKIIKELSTITWTIEFEKCFIYSLDSPSKKQKKASINMLNVADKNGRVMLFVYDSEQGGWTNPCEEDARQDKDGFINPSVAKEYVLKLGERVTEEELEELFINNKTLPNKEDHAK